MITYDFSEKVVVVTGSARGIGRRIAERFYAAGAKVALCSISKTGKEELMQEIAGDDCSRIMALSADVSRPEEVAAFLQAVVDAFGTIDVLVNNAGIYSKEDTCEVTEERYDKVMDANLKSVFFACQWFFKHHLAAGTTGNVVNIASVSSVTYVPDNALYNVSKAGVVTLTKTFARDMGKHGIRVNAVGPGSIPTDLNAALYADPQKEIELCDKIPLGRRGTKDDIERRVQLFNGSGCLCRGWLAARLREVLYDLGIVEGYVYE